MSPDSSFNKDMSSSSTDPTVITAPLAPLLYGTISMTSPTTMEGNACVLITNSLVLKSSVCTNITHRLEMYLLFCRRFETVALRNNLCLLIFRNLSFSFNRYLGQGIGVLSCLVIDIKLLRYISI